MLKSANIILFMINHINQKVEINPFSHSKNQLQYLKQGETLPEEMLQYILLIILDSMI